MTGTFSSFNTALSALSYNRVAMDVASGNIANVGTDGYVRRRVIGETAGAAPVQAMWSRYDGAGDGVRVAGLQRMTDPLLEVRARREHGNQAYLDIRQVVLERIEAGIGEPGEDGVAAALDAFRTGWGDLVSNPGSAAARAQVLGRASTLADAIRIQAGNIDDEAGDLRSRTLTAVAEVNVLAADLAQANRGIAVATLTGNDAGELLDERDRLALRLSEITGARATLRPDGGYDVTVNGVALVTGQDAGVLAVASGITPAGGDDGAPVTFSVTTTSGTTAVPDGVTGELGGLADLLDTTLPAYRAGLSAIAVQVADRVNTLHTGGYDAAGNAGVAFFSYDPADPAATLAVAFSDPALVAASSVPGGGLDTGNAEALGLPTGAEGAYQRLVNGFATEVASVRRLTANQQVMTDQVDASRDQLAGVNLDEETIAMVSSQRAYEAAARVMTTLDSVLDTLINRTGLMR